MAHEDAHLWEALAQARKVSDDSEVRRLRAEIVWTHHGFIVDYARRHAFRSWDPELVDEYIHELVEVALGRVETFQPERGIKFVTYIKPFFMPQRFKIQGDRAAIRVGHETARLAQMIHRHLTEQESLGLRPSLEEITEHVRSHYRSTIGPERVRRIVEAPRIISGDQAGEDGALWDHAPASEGAEGEWFAQVDREDTTYAVVSALSSMNLDPLNLAIVREVFMAAEPITTAELAERFEVTTAHVVAQKEHLAARLRDLLG